MCVVTEPANLGFGAASEGVYRVRHHRAQRRPNDWFYEIKLGSFCETCSFGAASYGIRPNQSTDQFRDRESNVTDSINAGSDKKPGEFKFRPVLLKGESKDEFAALVDELNRNVQPKQFIEHMYVNEIANLTWEIIRFRRFKTTLINNRYHRAPASILRQILFPPGTAATADTILAPDRLAYDWLTSQETKERVSRLLQEAGLDESSVEAEAFRLSLTDIENIDRLLASAEARREKALRFMALYQEGLARRLQQTSDRVLAADIAASITYSGSES